MKTAILLIGFAAGLQAQFVEGAVYDAITGNPLPGASVSAVLGANGPVARTDASGHFRIALQPNYAPSVTAAMTGYIQANVRVPAQNLQTMRVELKPEAIVTGKVLDEDGLPAGGAHLQAVRYQTYNGQRTLAFMGQSQSDEQGRYRIENLAAGHYYIRVYSNDAANWDRRYVAQYLGGTLQPDSSHMIEVKMGETRKETDIRLVRFEGVTVSGRLEGVSANPRVSGPLVSLYSTDSMPGPGFATLSRSGDMTFTIRHVSPGTYKLRYGSGNPRAGDFTAQLTVEVGDRDVRDLVLTPHAVQPVDLEGQVVAREGGSPGPWIVYLRPQMGPGVSAHTNEDGAFIAKGLLPEHYNVQAMPDRGAIPDTKALRGHVVSITLGDLDVQQKGFDLDGAPQKALHIVASTQYATISGTVLDPQGAPMANVSMYFQSNRPSQGGYSTTDDKGVFHAMLTEAGEYHVFVAVDQDAMSTQGEEYLKAHQGDFPVVHAILGENPPVTLVKNARPAQ